jgi:serine/threonine-protein kinase
VHETSRYPRPYGKYLLLRQLAVGGMAEVYLARVSGPHGFEKECVIKRILPSLSADQQFVQMFLDEARIAARLSHPNIVQIYDLGTVGANDYFLAMEHVHGVDLQQIVDAESKRNGRVPLPVALRLVSNVAEGLDHAHRATDNRGQPLGIVHRDVTPSNVIVSFDGVAKVLDFGIAKAVAKKGRTEVGVIKGKVPYMSPEQVQGEAIDARSDLFSLGTVLYELTIGHKPFDGQNPAELSIKILHDDPQPPELVVEGYPEALSAIVKRVLAKKRQARFASARELQDALEEFLVSTGVRCTSHDVAAYLNDLFPGRRERQAQEEAAQTMPVEATDPTMPNVLGPGEGDGEGPRQGMSADLSSPRLGSYDDVRRNLGGSGGGMKYVVVLLIVVVALGFWWLSGHMGQSADAKPAGDKPAAVDKPAGDKPATVEKPVELPNPGEQAAKPAEAAKPGDKPVVTPLQPATAPADKPAAVEKPAAPAEKPAEPAAQKTAPVEKAKPAHHAPPHHAPPHHAEPERALPRLPTPPPPDDAP